MFAKRFLDIVQGFQFSYLQVQGNHPVPMAPVPFYFEASVLNGGVNK